MYGVGIVGAGWVASEHIRAFECNPDSRVAAICSSCVASAEAKVKELELDVAICETYEEMLKRPDVDIICIATHIVLVSSV